jgi:hypothetical protein
VKRSVEYIWKLIRANEEPDETQRLDADFMAVWNQVNQGIAAANARVSILTKMARSQVKSRRMQVLPWRLLGLEVPS